MQSAQCINGHCCPRENSADTPECCFHHYNFFFLSKLSSFHSWRCSSRRTILRYIKHLESTSSHYSMLLSFYSFVFLWSVVKESEKSNCGSGVVVALFLYFSLYYFAFLWSVQKESEKSGCGSIYLFPFLWFCIFLMVRSFEKESKKSDCGSGVVVTLFLYFSFYSFVFLWSVKKESEKSDRGSGVVVALFLYFSLYYFVFLWSDQKESEKKWLWLYLSSPRARWER